MIDLLLDRSTGDAVFTEAALQSTEDRAELARIRAYLALAVTRGEYLLDRLAGAPWGDVLGRRSTENRLRQIVQQELLADPEIETVEAEVTSDPSRATQISATAVLISGEVVEVTVQP